jgi:pyruvate dehydrogenase E2 component (dihydrolipoamide acetyltransferase)
MSTDIIMPQMGESIAEGTLTKWLKKVGDEVKRDEPLFEISTDKVDAEIPSPVAGVLEEILVREGETVAINTVVARISEKAAAGKAAPAPQPTAPGTEPAPPTPVPAEKSAAKAPAASAERRAAAPIERRAASTPPREKAPSSAEPAPAPPDTRDAEAMRAARRETKSSPLVRRIARENNVDISRIAGTGADGRVTKKDILSFIESGAAAAPVAPRHLDATPEMAPPEQKVFSEAESVVREPMSIMRKKIAEHMIRSRRTSAHVTTVFEVDMSGVVARRDALKDEFLKDDVKLTFLPFIVEAVAKALKAFPALNASVDGETILYKKEINIGIAVALDWGLIVPVVKNADTMNLLGLAKKINDLAERARAKRLIPDEVQNGTFSITNPGVFGSMIGTPIINQPQVAIMDVGAVTKRPVVIDDAIAIRPMVYLSLSFDHRLIDGAVADQFMAHVKKSLETCARKPCP